MIFNFKRASKVHSFQIISQDEWPPVCLQPCNNSARAKGHFTPITSPQIRPKVSKLTCSTKCSIEVLHKVYFQSCCLDADASCSRLSSRCWILPLLPRPLTCPSSEETAQQPAVNTSCFPTDRQERKHSHHPPPSLLSPLLHLSNPHFLPSQSPSLVGWSFQLPPQQKKQKEAGPLSLFPPCREKKTCRPPLLKPQAPPAKLLHMPTTRNQAFYNICVEHVQECAGASNPCLFCLLPLSLHVLGQFSKVNERSC